MEQLSILHISDLHRGPSGAVRNQALFNSLQNDMNRYTTKPESLQKPNLIAVSGDLVQGLANNEPLSKMSQQYDEAGELLSDLADLFLAGDRNRIIIVPGNHDACWYYSRKSMQNIMLGKKGTEEKRKLVRKLMEGDSMIRWSWDDCQFQQVVSQTIYRKIFKPFSDFYEEFYGGTRHYSLNPADQYDIFDYPDFNTSIVSFNSCYSNDHCNSIGRIHPDCISQSIRKLRSSQYRGRLLIAMWHHSVRGLPLKADFLDSRCLKNLVESGFSIGLHGHQHEVGVVEENLSLSTGIKELFYQCWNIMWG